MDDPKSSGINSSANHTIVDDRERQKLVASAKETDAAVLSAIGLRRAIGVSGFVLPVVLGPIGWLFFGIDIQDNISSYYHTDLRDVFVGVLVAMGIFLFCYRGGDGIENWTANIGCVSVIGVALCPLDAGSDPLIQRSIIGYLHTICGGVFFITLAFYSLYHFPSTLFPYAKRRRSVVEPNEFERNAIYRISGLTILASLLAMATYLVLVPMEWKRLLNQYNFLFWMEWVAIWSFAAAWITKGRVIIADLAIELIAQGRQTLVSKITSPDRSLETEPTPNQAALFDSKPAIDQFSDGQLDAGASSGNQTDDE